MTKHDKLIDVIKDYLYVFFQRGKSGDEWFETDGAETAQSILEAVEEYQSTPNIMHWRATD